MTMPPVACPHCSQAVAVSSGNLGQVARCPRCGQPFQVQWGTPSPSMPLPPPPVIAPPPTPPTSGGWFVNNSGKQTGPFSLEMLQCMAESGQLKADAWVVMAETDACVLAAMVPGLVFRSRRTDMPGLRPAPPPAATTPVPVRRTPPAAAPRPQSAPAAPSAHKPAPLTIDCPHCRSKCLIPKPQAPTVFTCARCKQPFRAAFTSTGLVVQRVAAAPPAPRAGASTPGRR